MEYAVVTTYSFDTDAVIHLFKTYEDAVKFLKEDFEREKRIDTEENKKINERLTGISDDGSYAVLANDFVDGVGKTEWRVTSNIK